MLLYKTNLFFAGKMEEEDSFELIKQKIEKLPDHFDAPSKPLLSSMLFSFEKTCEFKKKIIEGSQTEKSNSLTEKIVQQWNNLSVEEKNKYEESYEAKLRKYDSLQQMYLRLTQQKKNIKPYNLFFKKMYAIYRQHYNFSPNEITKLIKDQWAILPSEDRRKYQIESKQSIPPAVYQQTLEQYQKQEQMQRERVLQKNGLTIQALNETQKQIFLHKNKKEIKKQMRRQTYQKQKKKSKTKKQQNYHKLKELKDEQIQDLKQERQRIKFLEELKRQNQLLDKKIIEQTQLLKAIKSGELAGLQLNKFNINNQNDAASSPEKNYLKTKKIQKKEKGKKKQKSKNT